MVCAGEEAGRLTAVSNDEELEEMIVLPRHRNYFSWDGFQKAL